jgi:hypothetical protein
MNDTDICISIKSTTRYLFFYFVWLKTTIYSQYRPHNSATVSDRELKFDEATANVHLVDDEDKND